MSIAALIRRMSELGATPEAIAVAVEAIEQSHDEERDARDAKQKSADRSRAYRVRKRDEKRDASRDRHAYAPLPSPPSLSPPTPSPITTPTPNPKRSNASHSRSARSALASDWPADFFDQFWNEYPKKVEKQATIRKLEALHRSGKLPWRVLMDGVSRYRASTAGTEQQFIKSPLVWLNKGCWDDEPAALVRATGPPRERRNGFDVVREECLQEMENGNRPDDPEPRFDLDLTPARPGVG